MTQTSKFTLEADAYLEAKAELNRLRLSTEQLHEAYAQLAKEHSAVKALWLRARRRNVFYIGLFFMCAMGHVAGELL
tara:strand:+ start:914 stop:1144 length:231 start_codon:yes stop_codon:yes gene_type:complete